MKLKSAKLVNQTRATFLQLTTSAAVTTLNRILLDAQEGNFVYFAKHFDTFSVRDGARPSDQMVFELLRYLADDSDVADLYIAEFNKIVGGDVAFIGDSIYTQRAYIRNLPELASTADAGSLRSQGYSDFTYFGEDFVGASRTF